MTFQYREECTGHYAQQSNFRLKAVKEAREAGFIEWTLFEKVASISMIHVHADFQRQGVATQLLKRLQQRDLEQRIDWGGYLTPEGLVFLKNSTFSVPNKSFSEAFEKLRSLDTELDLLQEKYHRGEECDVSMDHWNELHDKRRFTHEAVISMPSELIFVKGAGCPAEREWKLMCAQKAFQVISCAIDAQTKHTLTY